MNEAIIEQKSRELYNKISSARPNLDIKGKTYYVSADGDDNNDGLSENTPVKTLEKVTELKSVLKDGDAVLFRSGDIFRGQFTVTNGVTYSMYGDGAKPEIWGAFENAATLDWEKTEQENVYCAYVPNYIKDIGNIVFDFGKECGFRKHIEGDLELLMDLDFRHDKTEKKIYIYSEKGNPGERWSDIELCYNKTIISGKANNTTFDSLVLKYGAAHGIGIGSISYEDPDRPKHIGLKNVTVRNCEFEWIGGGNIRVGSRYGNAFEIWGGCDGLIFENNYINQIYDAGVTQQYNGYNFGDDPVMIENVVMRDNLIENCVYSYEYFLTVWKDDGKGGHCADPDNEAAFKNVLFENNICRKSGYGWGNQRPARQTATHIKSWEHTNKTENFVIKNNIFDRGDYLLVELLSVKDEYLPKLESNTYCQYAGKNWILTNGNKKSVFDRATIQNKQGLVEDDAVTCFARR